MKDLSDGGERTTLLQLALYSPVFVGQLLVPREQLMIQLGPDTGAILQG